MTDHAPDDTECQRPRRVDQPVEGVAAPLPGLRQQRSFIAGCAHAVTASPWPDWHA